MFVRTSVLQVSTNFYIDGFNLYYRALKTRLPQYKWLDIQSFCQSLLPEHEVKRVRYFTALLESSFSEPDVAFRQQTYLRALRTLDKVEIHYGRFETRRRSMSLWDPSPGEPRRVWIRRTEEKRSDVNLATHLMLDACDDDFDEAVVISNDSDLMEPIKAVRDRFNKRIGVVNPDIAKRRSADIQGAGSWAFPTIYRRYFRDNQLPVEIVDDIGTFHKPPSW